MTEVEVSPIEKSQGIVTPFFEIPIFGHFSKSNLEIEDTQQTNLKSAELQRRIEENWERLKEEVLKRGGKLENRPKVYVIDISRQDAILHLKLGRTTYKDFVGTCNTAIRLQTPEVIPRLLSVASILETSDHFLVLIERSQQVFQYPGWVGSLSGTVEVDDTDENGKIDPFKAAQKEIAEEVGIELIDISSLECLGFMRDRISGTESMVFQAKTSLTKSQIEEKQKEKALEEGKSVFVTTTPKEVGKRILELSKIFEPDGAAILTLLGREKFGENWFNFILRRLQRRGNVYAKLTQEQREILENRLISKLGRM